MKSAFHIQGHVDAGCARCVNHALVGNVAWLRHEHFVTGLHQAKDHRVQSILRTGTNHHLVRGYALPGERGVSIRNRLTQSGFPGKEAVVRASGFEAHYRSSRDRTGCIEIRIADTQQNDVLALVEPFPGVVVNRPGVGRGGIQSIDNGREFHGRRRSVSA